MINILSTIMNNIITKKYLPEYNKKLLLISCIITVNDSLPILIIFSFKILIDRHLPEKNLQAIAIILFSAFFVLTVRLLIGRKMQIMKGELIYSLCRKLRDDIFDKIVKTGANKSKETQYGSLNTKAVQDVESFSEIVNSIFLGISNLSYFVILLVFLSVTNFYLTIILYAQIIAFYIILNKAKIFMSGSFDAFAESRMNLNKALKEFIDIRKTINKHNLHEDVLHKIRAKHMDLNKSWLITNIFNPGIVSTSILAKLMSYLIIFLISPYFINSATLTLGGLFIFLAYIPEIWQRFLGVINIYADVLSLSIYMNRIGSDLCREDKEDINKVIALKTFCNDAANEISFGSFSIRIEKLKFRFDNVVLFENLSFRINKPGLYCIKGESGIGKSTLFDILLKYHEVERNIVFINNMDLTDYSEEGIRKVIGICHQEIFLINDTVLKNITLWDSGISEENVIEYSKFLGFHSYFLKLDNGYNELLNNHGQNISTGLKRMITILRTLVREPDILLLDEITSNIDSYSEIVIHKFIKNLSKDKICIMVTHREADIMLADEVFEIKAGTCNFQKTAQA